MTSDVDYLDLDDLLAVVEAELGPVREWVRDMGLLASAVERHRAIVWGEDVYPGLDGKAAALLHGLVTNHALIDGNKRLGLLAALLFLGLNGVRVTAGDDDLYDLVMAVADGTAREVPKIAEQLRAWFA